MQAVLLGFLVSGRLEGLFGGRRRSRVTPTGSKNRSRVGFIGGVD
jgi:hypothetical protein